MRKKRKTRKNNANVKQKENKQIASQKVEQGKRNSGPNFWGLSLANLSFVAGVY